MSFPYAPQVVAKLALTGQTTSLPLTTVYTPTVDGDYQIAAYITQSNIASGYASAELSWTDECGLVGHWSLGSGVDGSGTQTANPRVPAGSSIQVKTTYNSGNGTPPSYDLFVTVTQL